MRRTDERGASVIEYAGMVVLAGVVIAALQLAGVPAKVSAAASRSLCVVTDSCAEKPAPPKPTISCFRAPCGPTILTPRPAPPIECFRAACGTPPVRTSPSPGSPPRVHCHHIIRRPDGTYESCR